MTGDRLTEQQIAALVDTQLVGLNDQFVGRRPTCQHPQHTCRRAVTAVVSVHVLDNCDGEEADEFGNEVFLLCTNCARALWIAAQWEVRDRTVAATRAGVIPMCSTCQAPVAKPSHIVRDVRKYEEVFNAP